MPKFTSSDVGKTEIEVYRNNEFIVLLCILFSFYHALVNVHLGPFQR